jgi:hypothetical protein
MQFKNILILKVYLLPSCKPSCLLPFVFLHLDNEQATIQQQQQSNHTCSLLSLSPPSSYRVPKCLKSAFTYCPLGSNCTYPIIMILKLPGARQEYKHPITNEMTGNPDAVNRMARIFLLAFCFCCWLLLMAALLSNELLKPRTPSIDRPNLLTGKRKTRMESAAALSIISRFDKGAALFRDTMERAIYSPAASSFLRCTNRFP